MGAIRLKGGRPNRRRNTPRKLGAHTPRDGSSRRHLYGTLIAKRLVESLDALTWGKHSDATARPLIIQTPEIVMPSKSNRAFNPSAEQFKAALLASRPVNDKVMAMLKAHFRAPDHSLTTVQLAEAAAYRSVSSVNVHYGKFAKKLAETLGVQPPQNLPSGEGVWTSVIASGEEGNVASPNYLWTLRPGLVDAVKALPWGIAPRTTAQP
jgi:hypothetical protein